jgi:hypothetical protein
MSAPVVDTSITLSAKALLLIGANPIVSFADDLTEATIASNHYDTVYEAELCAFPWPFATTKASLTLLADAPADTWPFAWELPTDQIMIDAIKVNGQDIEYEINGSDVLCGWNTGVIATYRWKPPESQLPPYFKRALIHRLAATFAMPLERWDAGAKQDALAERFFAQARLKASQSITSKKLRTSRLVDIRRTSGSAGDGFVTGGTATPAAGDAIVVDSGLISG